MRKLIAVVALLASLPANANEIDYFCIFANAAAAQADAGVGRFWNGTLWDTSTTFPGVSVTTAQALVNGVSSATGFWIIVSRTASDAGLDANTNCVMKLDRDIAVRNGNFVLAAAITGTNRTNLTFRPVPQAAAYPIPLGR